MNNGSIWKLFWLYTWFQIKGFLCLIGFFLLAIPAVLCERFAAGMSNADDKLMILRSYVRCEEESTCPPKG